MNPEIEFEYLSDELFTASETWTDVTGYDILIDFAKRTTPTGGNRPAFWGDGEYELELFVSGVSVGTYDSLEDVERVLREFEE